MVVLRQTSLMEWLFDKGRALQGHGSLIEVEHYMGIWGTISLVLHLEDKVKLGQVVMTCT